jgi:hypothetical protein
MTLFITSFGFAGWIGVANAAEESSLLVEKDPKPAAVAPQLIPPSNAESIEILPPPSKPAHAKEATANQPKQPFMRPAEPRRRVPATTALAVKEESMPAPDVDVVESPAIEVRPAPPIEYDTDRRARRMYRESGEVNVVMIARNPADGCYYEIPMCIPACCVGEPKVEGGRGILGRGVVEFCWECGFTAVVKFRHVLGDVKVDYEGD